MIGYDGLGWSFVGTSGSFEIAKVHSRALAFTVKSLTRRHWSDMKTRNIRRLGTRMIT
jgi:hypothetical protein